MKKLSNTETELKKSVAYKKACVSLHKINFWIEVMMDMIIMIIIVVIIIIVMIIIIIITRACFFNRSL